MRSQMYFKSSLQAEELGTKGIQSVLLYIIPSYGAGGEEGGN